MNVSMNQVLMRSLNTSLAAVLPVLSLLILGAGIMGAVTLREFALALLVGLITGSYSSIFVATPVLAILKEKMAKYQALRGSHATGDDLERLVLGAAPAGRDRRARVRSARVAGATAEPTDAVGDVNAPILPAGPKAVLTHPPRPRKKKRR
jgi:preprotein translocase subunit SecF